MILGIDEVGRGPWAGPLVVGAVVLGGTNIPGLTDSKKISKKRRDELDVVIRESAAGFGLGWVHAVEIDEIGLSEALRLATRRAVEQVMASYHEIIIDGTINFLDGTRKGRHVTTMAKADLLIPSVSAASIIAKVARDNFMAEQDNIYEGYKFASHVGYGTAVHREAIKKLGVTPLHRLSFAPLAQYRVDNTVAIASNIDSPNKVGSLQTAVAIGNKAESAAAAFLETRGHEILDRNWKTKYCEIDIISRKGETVYFTEVKYRKSANQGGGFAAITKTKLRQMKFAANYYAQVKKLSGTEMRLAAAAVSGEPPIIEEWIGLY